MQQQLLTFDACGVSPTSPTPQLTAPVVAVAAGWGVCAAATSDGELAVWGVAAAHEFNARAAIPAESDSGGDEEEDDATAATAVVVVRSLACSRDGARVFATTSSGALYDWRARAGGIQRVACDIFIAQVAVGEAHVLLLAGSGGAVLAFGANDHGQLGFGAAAVAAATTTASHDRPTIVRGLPPCVAIAAGWSSSAAVTAVGGGAAGGELYTWGWGRYSQLGHDASADEPSPRRVDALRGVPIARVACGAWHSAAVSVDGAPFAWGWKRHGQVVAAAAASSSAATAMQSVPLLVPLPESATIDAVVCGARHTIWVDTAQSKAWACGWMGIGGDEGDEDGGGGGGGEECGGGGVRGPIPLQPSALHSLTCASGSSAWHAVLLVAEAE